MLAKGSNRREGGRLRRSSNTPKVSLEINGWEKVDGERGGRPLEPLDVTPAVPVYPGEAAFILDIWILWWRTNRAS